MGLNNTPIPLNIISSKKTAENNSPIALIALIFDQRFLDKRPTVGVTRWWAR